MSLLENFIAAQVFAFLIIFARIGCAMMVMPGIGDTTVPMNIRLYFVLAFSFILIPVLQPFLPQVIPQEPIAFAILVSKELLIGLFIGLMTQVMMNAMNLAAAIVSHATSLSNASVFNPQMAAQSSVITGFFSLVVMVLIFATDLHHLLFIGFIDSYRVFPPTDPVMFGDIVESMARNLGEAFRIGLMIAAPFVVVSMGVFIAMGLVARLVPQIQVFSLSVPVQVLTGLVLLLTSLSAMMLYFIDAYEAFWRNFFTG